MNDVVSMFIPGEGSAINRAVRARLSRCLRFVPCDAIRYFTPKAGRRSFTPAAFRHDGSRALPKKGHETEASQTPKKPEIRIRACLQACRT
jgi:hypothetical protein